MGLGVSRGIGRGSVVFLPSGAKPHFRDHLTDADVANEIRRFSSAVDTSIGQLRALAKSHKENGGDQVSEIFSVHLLILESSFVDETETLIKEQRVNAESAIESIRGKYSAKQASLADENFRDRYLDIDDVASRLKRAMRGTRTPIKLHADAVVVARELRPSAVVELAKYQPAGLITEIGGWTSHMSIVAREFHLPMVTGIKNAEKFLTAGDVVVVDGNAGEVLLNPDGFSDGSSHSGRSAGTVEAMGQAPRVMTTDGIEIVIRANTEDSDTYRSAERMGACGVGLYRSELLISEDGLVPGEDSQMASYSEIARATGKYGVAIRTFDISPEHLADSGNSERNPALGMRAIRSGLSQPEFFRAQIRAILRASIVGRIDIILPMVSNVGEIVEARSIISELVGEIRNEGFPVDEPRVGVMVEVPSTVFLIPRILKNVDFLCLGTNDLVQYLLAVDRDNEAVAAWYQTLNPAVLSAIRIVLEASSSAGIPTTVCGEMAGSPFYVPVLIGLGARDLGINTNSIATVKNLVSGISAAETTEIVERLETFDTAEQIENFLREQYHENWESLFPAGLISAKHR